MGIISFSGKKNSGKDTAGKIAQILLSFNGISNDDIIKYLNGGSFDNPKWKIKKWATYLKQILADLSNCTLEEMELEDVKNEIIYTKYAIINKFNGTVDEYDDINEGLFAFEKLKLNYLKIFDIDKVAGYIQFEPIEITRRIMLERIGTEVGRYINKDIWVNHLMSNYKETDTWIITDTRFPNEAEAVIHKGGVNIRLERTLYKYKGELYTAKVFRQVYFVDHKDEPESGTYDRHKVKSTHVSDTALDSFPFTYVIDNNHGLNHLIKSIRSMLIDLKLIECQIEQK